MGAFAIAQSGACGWSWGKKTLAVARESALQECSKRGSNCKVHEVHMDQKGDWTLSVNCKRDLASWQKKAGRAVFAVEQGGGCGWSWGGKSLSAARRMALQYCRRQGPNCKILRTK